MVDWIAVTGIVTPGHRVASGQNQNPRFPGGTLAMQKPMFQQRGLSLDHYFGGTINLSIDPKQYRVRQPKVTFRSVDWSNDSPPEDFSFFDCRVVLEVGRRQDGLIYYPHPDTKPEHFQSPSILEILTDFITGLTYGDQLVIEVNQAQIMIS